MMDKIVWMKGDVGYTAYVGNMILSCHHCKTHRGREWSAKVEFLRLPKHGPIRSSLDVAKSDAVNIAKNLLVDLMRITKKEMVVFGIGGMWDE